jgi:rhodanese-related sulfurtransferase
MVKVNSSIECLFLEKAYVTGSALSIILLAVLSATGWSFVAPDSEHYSSKHWHIGEITPEVLAATFNNVLLLDVRPDNDFSGKHIPGAILFNSQKWDESIGVFLDAWSPGKPIVVYCSSKSCALGKEISLRLLRDLPDLQIYVLKGGYYGWEAYQVQQNPAHL